MPPREVLQEIGKMVDWQLSYLLTAGDHSSNLPVYHGAGLFSQQAAKWKVTDLRDLM